MFFFQEWRNLTLPRRGGVLARCVGVLLILTALFASCFFFAC